MNRAFLARLASLLSSALLAPPSTTHAQLPVKFSIAGGWTFPTDPSSVTRFWNGSVNGAAGVNWRANSHVLTWAEISYHRGAFDTGAFETSIDDVYPNVNASGNHLQVVPITVGADIALTGWGNTRPYAAVGLGYYSVSVTSSQTSGPGAADVDLPDPSDSAFGARVGLGVRTLVTPAVTLFLDATYHVAWTSPDALAFVPLRVGLRF